MINQIIGEESVCRCKGMLKLNIDIGDGFLYDICCGCGFRRKKTMDGVEVEIMYQEERTRRAEAKRKDEGRELI